MRDHLANLLLAVAVGTVSIVFMLLIYGATLWVLSYAPGA